MTRFLIVLSLIILTGACSPALQTCPPPQASRCNGHLVELCSPDKEWQKVMDCSSMGTTWKCLPTTEGHACMPSKEVSK